MGFLDKIKGLGRKNERQIDQGIDRSEEVAHDKVGDQVGHDKIDSGADHAHDAADKLTDD